MTMTEHIAKAFDADLEDLTRMVAEMGGLAEKNVADAVDSLIKRDTGLAAKVIERDAAIDELQRQVEERAILTIARRQPMAVDLREVVAALRVCNDLERIGDLAKNIAKRVSQLTEGLPPQTIIRGIEHMSGLVLGQLKQVLDSYATRNIGNALEVWQGDEQIDSLCTSLFREILTYMAEDPRSIGRGIHMMFSAKNIERIGDHATNIAETVHYMVEGRPLTAERPKRDTTAFVPAQS
jgi:phosphate transport system protein